MPALDAIHHAVKNALIKDGWVITADPYLVNYKGTKVYIDLAAEYPIAAERNGEKIAVEIKSFLGRSALRELEVALGQYLFYHRLLSFAEPERKLYLAIDDEIYRNLFQRPAIQDVINAEQIPLLVVNPSTEVIVTWLN